MSRIAPGVETIPHLFAWRATLAPQAPAMWIKKKGAYQAVSWQTLEQDVLRAVDVLAQAGVQPADRVVHVAENRYEWVVTDLAIQSLGAIHVPLHASLAMAQQVEQYVDAEPAALIVASHHPEQTRLEGDRRMRGVPQFSYLDQPPAGLESWPSALAAADPERGRQVREQRLAQLDPQSIATILYTSGTTGEPKGVMLSQGNITSNAIGTAQVFGDQADEVRLNFLPLSHIFARTCDIYIWIVRGVQLALAESRETIIDDCLAIHPHLMNGVPYFFERLMRTLHAQGIADEPGVLRQALGGNMRLCCSGGAALPDAVYDYFHSQGLPLLQGYGLTESSPVITVNAPQASRRGAVGRPIENVEVRIAEDGEILTRGPHVMQGYWRKPAATEEVIHDGWLLTGDLGKIDEDGYVWITGRKKEILVTAGGKNIAPVLLESLMTQDPLILQAMVIGDGCKYLSALIVPDADVLRTRIAAAQLPELPWEQYFSHPTVLSWFHDAVRQRLSDLSHYEQVQKCCLLSRPFSIEEGELTPKLSLRRPIIMSRYQVHVESMY